MSSIIQSFAFPHQARNYRYGHGWHLMDNGLLYEFEDDYFYAHGAGMYETMVQGIRSVRHQWEKCIKPRDGADRLKGRFKAEHKVTWVLNLTYCTVCYDGMDRPKDYWEEIQGLESLIEDNSKRETDRVRVTKGMGSSFSYYPRRPNDGLIAKLESMNVHSPVKYGICDRCNPRKNKMVSLGDDMLSILGKCWPSFRAMHLKLIGKPQKQKERIVLQWVKRNPQKVSTESARNFFKLSLGISNLEKFINKTQKQNQHYATNRN